MATFTNTERAETFFGGTPGDDLFAIPPGGTGAGTIRSSTARAATTR